MGRSPGYIKPFTDRKDFIRRLASRRFESACEVGVQAGAHAVIILRYWPLLKKFYLVDLWKHQKNYRVLANVDDEAHEERYRTALERLDPWKKKTIFLRGYSTTMAEQIEADTLDFVCLDARHDYYGCTEDLEAYWPKLRRGGVLSGHDYCTAREVKNQDWSVGCSGERHPGAVKGAVDDFAFHRNLQVVVGYREALFNTWAFLKPCRATT